MAHIIKNIGLETISKQTNEKITLNCMHPFRTNKSQQQHIYDADAISQRIEQAAKIKQQLEKDIFEREKNIQQSAEARNKI